MHACMHAHTKASAPGDNMTGDTAAQAAAALEPATAAVGGIGTVKAEPDFASSTDPVITSRKT